MKSFTLLLSLLLTHSAFAGFNHSLLNNLIIVNGKSTIALSNTNSLSSGLIDVKFDSKTLMWGTSKLQIIQGKTKLDLIIPRDRFHDSTQFTLHAVDTNLNQDIFLRLAPSVIIAERNEIQNSSCQAAHQVGFDKKTFQPIYQMVPGTQVVENKITTLNTKMTISFVEFGKTVAQASQDNKSEKKDKLRDISVCAVSQSYLQSQAIIKAYSK